METLQIIYAKPSQIRNTCAALIAIMLCYAALSKLTDYQVSKEQMLNQVFPNVVALQLTWLVPAVEVLIAIGLIIKTTVLKSLYASLLLMTAFSIYISLTMTGIFGRTPCSCGGILKNMSYTTHLLFNLFFIILAVIGIKADQRWLNYKWLNLKRKENCPKLNKPTAGIKLIQQTNQQQIAVGNKASGVFESNRFYA